MLSVSRFTKEGRVRKPTDRAFARQLDNNIERERCRIVCEYCKLANRTLKKHVVVSETDKHGQIRFRRTYWCGCNPMKAASVLVKPVSRVAV
jgi:hypothetical protein